MTAAHRSRDRIAINEIISVTSFRENGGGEGKVFLGDLIVN